MCVILVTTKAQLNNAVLDCSIAVSVPMFLRSICLAHVCHLWFYYTTRLQCGPHLTSIMVDSLKSRGHALAENSNTGCPQRSGSVASVLETSGEEGRQGGGHTSEMTAATGAAPASQKWEPDLDSSEGRGACLQLAGRKMSSVQSQRCLQEGETELICPFTHGYRMSRYSWMQFLFLIIIG